MKKVIFAFMKESPLYRKYGEDPEFKCISGGRYNGYVGFSSILPNTCQGGADYELEETLDNMIEVHGGITYDGKVSEFTEIIPLTDIPKYWYKYRIIGFDCQHCYDTQDNCTKEYAKKETLSLLRQIREIINKKADLGNTDGR